MTIFTPEYQGVMKFYRNALLIALTLPLVSAGQDTVTVNFDGGYANNPKIIETPFLPAPFFSLQAGAFFHTIPGAHLYGTSITPMISQSVGKRLTMSAGAVIGNTTFSEVSNTGVENTEGFSRGNFTSLTLFTAGSYQLNERVTISGSAYKTVDPGFNQRLDPKNLMMEAQGVSIGVGYRISDNVHIGAGIRMEDGRSNINSPHRRYGFPGLAPMPGFW